MYQLQQQQNSTSKFVEDDLPLPSYDEVFAFLFPSPVKQPRVMPQSTNHLALYSNHLVATQATNQNIASYESNKYLSLSRAHSQPGYGLGGSGLANPYGSMLFNDNSTNAQFDMTRSSTGSNNSHASSSSDNSVAQKKRKAYNKKSAHESDSTAG